MKILYFGSLDTGSTSLQRKLALERLGHEVIAYNPFQKTKKHLKNKYLNFFHYRTGYYFLQKTIENWVKSLEEFPFDDFDVAWVDSGELFGPSVVQSIKSADIATTLYCVDDLTGCRDGRRFLSAKKAVPYYDLCLTPRTFAIKEYKRIDARCVQFFWRSYDEVVHLPWIKNNILEKFISEVAFIGTWFERDNRDSFLAYLIVNGIEVSIWGNRWHKSPLWSLLKPYWRGPALSERDYTAAVQGAKVCLGFLSHGNRDESTRRSAEIPFIGTVFCAERTAEHLAMYDDMEEAAFWSDKEECLAVCQKLLENDALRESIARKGRERVIRDEKGNEKVCQKILDKLVTLQ